MRAHSPRSEQPRRAAGPRRAAASAALAAGVLGAPWAAAQSLDAANPTPSSAQDIEAYGEPAPTRFRHLGLMFDLGTLNGGMLSLVYRPSPWLRMYGGAGTNGAAPGLRAGAAVLPFRRGFGVSLDGGHFFGRYRLRVKVNLGLGHTVIFQ